QDEVLRFDCFERQPHYHYAWSKNDHYVPLDTAAEGDPVQWTLARLRTRLPAMLIRADAADLARTLDQRDIDAALPQIAGWTDALQARARQQGWEASRVSRILPMRALSDGFGGALGSRPPLPELLDKGGMLRRGQPLTQPLHDRHAI